MCNVKHLNRNKNLEAMTIRILNRLRNSSFFDNYLFLIYAIENLNKSHKIDY